ncbi:MAG: hypothetical protein ACRDOU_09900 [Streptosporangiaceae bacterium]
MADGFCRLKDRWAAVKAFLMHQDRDVDLGSDLPPIADAIIQDLEVDALLTAMAAGNEFLRGMARRAMLSGLADPEAIVYRQQVLSDAIAHPDVVRELYDIAVTAITCQKRNFFFPLSSSPDLILHWSVQVLEMFTGMLKRLRAVTDTHGAGFRSPGFARFFSMIAAELDDGYLGLVEGHLGELEFRRGILMSAGLGKGGKGLSYTVRKPAQHRPGPADDAGRHVRRRGILHRQREHRRVHALQAGRRRQHGEG